MNREELSALRDVIGVVLTWPDGTCIEGLAWPSSTK